MELVHGSYSGHRFKGTDRELVPRKGQVVRERVQCEGTCGDFCELRAALLSGATWVGGAVYCEGEDQRSLLIL